jgi:hypothetical protein
MARTLASSLFAATTILSAHTAFAHPEFNPVQVNRYLKFETDARGLVLVYTWLYGAAPAYPLRKSYDKNGDGVLDVNEQTRLGDELLARTLQNLHAELDGKALTPVAEKPAIGLSGTDVSAEPLSVDLTLHFASGAGAHRLFVDDKNDVPGQGEVEVRAEDPIDGAPLFVARGRDAGAKDKKFVFTGERRSALEDRSFTVAFVARAQQTSRALIIAACAAVVLAFGSFGLVWRSRRRDNA